VIIVAMGEGDRRDSSSVDCRDNRCGVVGGIDHDDFAVVAHQPDVVGDLSLASIEPNESIGSDKLDHKHQCSPIPGACTHGVEHAQTP
jgi:hypothetical protein